MSLIADGAAAVRVRLHSRLLAARQEMELRSKDVRPCISEHTLTMLQLQPLAEELTVREQIHEERAKKIIVIDTKVKKVCTVTDGSTD